jgi:hypothetical protein
MIRHLKYLKRRDSSTIGLGFKQPVENNLVKLNSKNSKNSKNQDESEQYKLLSQHKQIKQNNQN